MAMFHCHAWLPEGILPWLVWDDGMWRTAHLGKTWETELVGVLEHVDYFSCTVHTLYDIYNITYIYICTGWWFGTWILFFHILGIIIPTDELFFSEGLKPSIREHIISKGWKLFQNQLEHMDDLYEELDHCPLLNNAKKSGSLSWWPPNKKQQNMTFWLVVWNMSYCSIYWEFHHPNWRTHIFQRGRSTTNQH